MAKFREIFRGKSKYVTVRAEAEAESVKKKQQPSQPPKEVPDGLWTKCPQCGEMLYNKDLERNLYVCSKCGYHFRIGARERLAQLVDDLDPFVELDAGLVTTNPLDFPNYPEKLKADSEKTGLLDAVITGIGKINGIEVVLAVMDFHFMGGSMGSVVGERVTRAFERATELGLPVVTVSVSGGARMQEGIISLMQMEKTCAAVERHSRRGLLYISVLADPCMAGVFGSFASLGDINIAEPGATVGFAGQRVIEETIRRALPPALQKAETVFANGFVDRIVPRGQLKETIGKLLLWHVTERPLTPAEAPPGKEQGDAASQAEPDAAREGRGGKAAGEASGTAGGSESQGHGTRSTARQTRSQAKREGSSRGAAARPAERFVTVSSAGGTASPANGASRNGRHHGDTPA